MFWEKFFLRAFQIALNVVQYLRNNNALLKGKSYAERDPERQGLR